MIPTFIVFLEAFGSISAKNDLPTTPNTMAKEQQLILQVLNNSIAIVLHPDTDEETKSFYLDRLITFFQDMKD